MSRCHEAHKAHIQHHDSVDTVDTVTPAPARTGHSVNTVNSVTLSEKETEGASDAALEATERAAIIAESEHSNAAAPVPHRLPPSWADASAIPSAGARCHCCKGARWWCEAVKPNGWRCTISQLRCHFCAG